MKILRTTYLVVVSFVFLQNISGQGFVNLNFEQAVIVTDPSVPYYPYGVYASNALPGWTGIGFLSPNYITYDDLSLGATSVTLCGTNSQYSPSSLDGRFSIDLYGGVEGPAAGASISQTGLVPSNAASIRFIAQGVIPASAGGPLLLSLGGQNISYFAISTGPNYTVYGGDISAFAGQIAQLTFNTPQGNNNYWELDDIQFSSSPVPEPSVWSLIIIFTFMLCWYKKRPNKSPEPTAVGAGSSANAVHVASRRWFSFLH